MPVKVFKQDNLTTLWVYGYNQLGEQVCEVFDFDIRHNSYASRIAHIADNTKILQRVSGISTTDPWSPVV